MCNQFGMLNLLKKTILLLAFIYVVLINNANTQRSSPCPNVFRYNKFEPGRWTGQITLTTSKTLFGIWLRIILDKKANVLINWFGDSTTIDNKEYLIKNRNIVLKPGADPLVVDIQVDYDTNEDMPVLEDIRVNGAVICLTDVPNSKPSVVTTETSTIKVTQPPSSSPPPPPPQPSSSQPPPQPSSSQPPPPPINIIPGNTGISLTIETIVNQCGVIPVKGNPLIIKGQNTEEGDWPWHLAIYDVNGNAETYICGGSLLSKYHAVTAAHCVTKPGTNEPRITSQLKFYMGTSNLRMRSAETQENRAAVIIVHPEYSPTSLFNDLGIVKLETQVTFTNLIRPICLWEGDTDITKIEYQLGTVVGWGFDENKNITENLMKTTLPVIPLSTCLYSNREFFSHFLFDNNYCAGYKNGTSVCNGDSGGGMVFRRENSNVWQLRGIVSIGVSAYGYLCDPKNYVVFTDVSKYNNWIKEQTK